MHDVIICQSELRLGLLAQNCLAPGANSLLTQLLSNACEQSNSGCGQYPLRIQIGRLPRNVKDMKFHAAAKMLYAKYEVLLLAVQSSINRRITEDEVDTQEMPERLISPIHINPQWDLMLTESIVGYFIVHGSQDISHFWPLPKEDIPAESTGGNQLSHAHDSAPVIQINQTKGIYFGPSDGHRGRRRPLNWYTTEIPTDLPSYRNRSSSTAHRPTLSVQCACVEELTDYTALFHWCATHTLRQATVHASQLAAMHLTDHIVVFVLADSTSPPLGLVNLVMPLRRSSIPHACLKTIVLVGDPAYLQHEWPTLANFPHLLLYHCEPVTHGDLLSLRVLQCAMCVVLSAKTNLVVDKTQIDSEALLLSLNLKSMSEWTDHGVLKTVPMAVLLEAGSSIALLEAPGISSYKSASVASGEAVQSNCLDSLLAQCFHDSAILTMARSLLTSCDIAEHDRTLAEGLGVIHPRYDEAENCRHQRCSITLRDIDEEMFRNNKWYGGLILAMMNERRAVCLGLSRVIQDGTETRVVIGHPRKDFSLLCSDKVFCLQCPYAQSNIWSSELFSIPSLSPSPCNSVKNSLTVPNTSHLQSDSTPTLKRRGASSKKKMRLSSPSQEHNSTPQFRGHAHSPARRHSPVTSLRKKQRNTTRRAAMMLPASSEVQIKPPLETTHEFTTRL